MVGAEKKKSGSEVVSLETDVLETLYHGKSDQAFDSSHRVKLSKGWIISGSPKTFFIIQSFPEHRLVVYPIPIFNKVRKDVIDQVADQEQRLQFEGDLSTLVQRVDLDNQGRFTVPESLFNNAGFTGRAIILGLFEKFEIWPAEHFRSERIFPAPVTKLQEHLKKF